MAGTASGSRSPLIPDVTSRFTKAGAGGPRLPVTSRSVRPYMLMRTTRPVPAHISFESSARTLPVRMNCPAWGSASTARLTAPSTSGTSCHSSMSSGREARRAASGSARKAAGSAGQVKAGGRQRTDGQRWSSRWRAPSDHDGGEGSEEFVQVKVSQARMVGRRSGRHVTTKFMQDALQTSYKTGYQLHACERGRQAVGPTEEVVRSACAPSDTCAAASSARSAGRGLKRTTSWSAGTRSAAVRLGSTSLTA